jgi:predicted flap endonuclease-1-like 5' DNA nuclease
MRTVVPSAEFESLSGEDDMNQQMKELQKLKGIGKVLSQRLVESSYDTIAKIAAAQEKGLERIAGMNPKKVRSIVTQAREMTGEAEKGRHTWLEEKDGGNVHQVSGAGQRNEKNP